MQDLNAFKTWAAAKATRSVSIEISTLNNWLTNNEPTQAVKIWAYDSQLQTGQFVSSVDEIDLDQKKVEEAHRKLAEAQKTIDQAAMEKAEAEAVIAAAEEGQHRDGLH